MSLQKSAPPPLQIDLRGSRWLMAMLVLMHGGAVLWLGFLPWPWWSLLPIVLVVIASLYLTLDRHVFRTGGASLIRLIWDGTGDWWLLNAAGEWLPARLLGDSYIHPRLVVLNFICRGSKRSVLLLPDVMDPVLLRRLRVRLLIEGLDQARPDVCLKSPV